MKRGNLKAIEICSKYNIDNQNKIAQYINNYFENSSQLQLIGLQDQYIMDENFKYIVIGLPNNFKQGIFFNLCPYIGIKVFKNKILKNIQMFYGQYKRRII